MCIYIYRDICIYICVCISSTAGAQSGEWTDPMGFSSQIN